MSYLALENFAESGTLIPMEPSGPCHECPASFERGVEEGRRQVEADLSDDRAKCVQSLTQVETLAQELDAARASFQKQLIDALSVLIGETFSGDLETLCTEHLMQKMNSILADVKNTPVTVKAGTALYGELVAKSRTITSGLTIEHDLSSKYTLSIDMGKGGIDLGYDAILLGFKTLIKNHIQTLQDSNYDQ